MGEPPRTRVSATVILDQLRIARDLHGAVVDDALATLPPKQREEVASMLPGGWLSVDTARAAKDAIAAALGEDPIAFQRRVCTLGTERTLNTIWRFFLRQLSDDGIVKRLPILYTKSFDRGVVTLAKVQPGVGEFELRDHADISDYDLVGLSVGLATVLTAGGRKEVHVTYSRLGNVVHLHAKWKR